MSASPNDLPQFLTAKCPSCGTRVTATRDFAGRAISCPACLAEVPIATQDKPRTPAPVEGEDEFWKDVATVPAPAAVPPPKKQRTKSARQPEKRAVDESEAKQPAATTYSIPEPSAPPPLKVDVFKNLARIRRTKRPKPPKHPFLSNVFQFPWKTAGTLMRWCWLTAGFSVTGVILWFCNWLLATQGQAAWIGIGFFGISLLWFGLWSLSYAAACSVTIVLETAAGMNRVEGWPDGSWRDWLFEFVQVVYIHAVSGMVGLCLAVPLQFVLGYLTPQLLLVQMLTFPIVWLCAMDADSVWVPFSSTILASFKRNLIDWGKFYALTTAMLVAYLGIVLSLAWFIPWIAALVFGPLTSSLVFIYARLLGRLAWRITGDAPQPATVAQPQRV